MATYPIVARDRPNDILQAELVLDMSAEQYQAIDSRWSSFKDAHCPDVIPENHSWLWKQKLLDASDFSHQFFALNYDEEVQGMACVSLSPVASRNRSENTGWLLYIEYLETAPWNQRAYAGDACLFGGVGTSLLTAAIRMSEERGCEGRLALHSLEGARAFYLAQGFKSIEFDPVEQLDYFELST